MKKKVLAVTAACALSAATAVPALALENEFHGMFRVFGTVSNFGSAGAARTTTSGPLTGVGTTITTNDLAENAKTRTYMEQRARLM